MYSMIDSCENYWYAARLNLQIEANDGAILLRDYMLLMRSMSSEFKMGTVVATRIIIASMAMIITLISCTKCDDPFPIHLNNQHDMNIFIYIYIRLKEPSLCRAKFLSNEWMNESTNKWMAANFSHTDSESRMMASNATLTLPYCRRGHVWLESLLLGIAMAWLTGEEQICFENLNLYHRHIFFLYTLAQSSPLATLVSFARRRSRIRVIFRWTWTMLKTCLLFTQNYVSRDMIQMSLFSSNDFIN